MTFLTFIVPNILEERKFTAPGTNSLTVEETIPAAVEETSPPAIEKDVVEAIDNEASRNDEVDDVLIKGFKKLDSEILKLRDNRFGDSS